MKTTIPKKFGDKRWIIIYGEYTSTQAVAVDRIYSTVMQYVEYVLTVSRAEEVTQDTLSAHNIILVGTPKDNIYIKNLVEENKIDKVTNAQGYNIMVTASPFNSNRQLVVISACAQAGLLYGCVDFEARVVSDNLATGTHNKYFKNPFESGLSECVINQAPSIEKRSIWTWGHTICDYRRFVDNMTSLKLNAVVIWNDHVPVNMRDIIEYAKLNCIEVIFGFSWGWGVDINISDQKTLDEWAERVLYKYETEYLHLNGDGVYFQIFTETNEAEKDGFLIAQKAAEWVNVISDKVLSKYPDLTVQFGLHASSVKEHLGYIAQIDTRVQIIWEDCGAFPFDYLPYKTAGFQETMQFAEQISVLRGKEDKFGVVLKGFTALDWLEFEHQQGSFVMGKATDCYNTNRLREKEKIWRLIQAYWLKNADCLHEFVNRMKSIKGDKVFVQALVEDGMFESQAWFPVAVYAEILWDCTKSINDIMCSVALNPIVKFANS